MSIVKQFLKEFGAVNPVLLRRWSWLLVVSLMVVSLLVSFGAFKNISNVFYDYVQRLSVEVPDKNIIVVGIDEGTINEFGGWPIPRKHYSDFLLRLDQTRNSPRAIGLDLLMLEPTPDDSLIWSVLQSTGTFVATQMVPGRLTGEKIPQTLAIGPPSGSPLIAHINFSIDDDGLIRSVYLFDSGIPQLALSLSGKSASFDPKETSLKRFKLVNPRFGFTTISLADALSPNYPLSTFKDAYVLVGVTAQSLVDRYPSSSSGKKQVDTARVMYNASVLNALLHDHLIDVAPLWLLLAVYGLILCVVMLGYLFLSPSVKLFVTLSILIVFALFSGLLLLFAKYWIDPTPVLIAIPLLKLVWSWTQMQTIVSYVQQKTLDLQVLQPSTRTEKSRSGTFTQTAGILNIAILSVKNRFNNLKATIDNLPEAMFIMGPDHRVVLHNDKFSGLFAAGMLDAPARLDHLLISAGSTFAELEAKLQSKAGDQYLTLTDREGKRHKFLPSRVNMSWNERDTLSLIMLVDVTTIISLQDQRDRTLQLLSHDMRTPVAGILMLCREASVATDASDWANRIAKHARRTLSMMDDFIHSIRAEADHYEQSEQFFDSLMEQSLHEVRTLANDRGIIFDLNLEDYPYLKCDPRLIERVLVNLFVNAVRYSRPNSTITVNVSIDQAIPGSAQLVCTIQNVMSVEGSDGPHEIAHKGFGLGLAFVQQVVARHHGTFTQDFQGVNGIASVTLRLPCLPAEA